jgi:hypothetical protein
MRNENFIIVKEYFKTKGILLDAENPSHRVLLRRNLRAAKELLECAGGDVEKAVEAVYRVSRWAKSKRLSYSLETATKRFLDDNTPEQRPYIIEHGKRYELRLRNGDFFVLDGGRWYKYSGAKKDIHYE